MNEELLTTEQLAERWHCSRSWLMNMRSEGKGVPYVKLGSKVLYRLSDVLALEAESVTEPANA